MEPHPVPQNIIDVEFKLFGSFTLKQFSKILFGCLAGVGIYMININPLIKIPLIMLAVGIGLGLAVIPNLSVWLQGFIKALFISPRYVWVKTPSTPELLTTTAEETKARDKQNIDASLSKKKLGIDEVPFDRLFSGTKVVKKEDSNDEPVAKNDNFIRVYEEVFGDEVMDAKRNPYEQNAQIVTSPAQPTNNSQQFGSTPQSVQQTQKTRQYYVSEIERLKRELSLLNKDQNYKTQEQRILSDINELYREVKLLENVDLPTQRKVSQQTQIISASPNQGRVIFGIVVSKKDQPISGVQVTFTNSSRQSINITTGVDGKFTTINPLPIGEYAIQLNKPPMRFHTYKISIGSQNLPAYKFREK